MRFDQVASISVDKKGTGCASCMYHSLTITPVGHRVERKGKHTKVINPELLVVVPEPDELCKLINDLRDNPNKDKGVSNHYNAVPTPDFTPNTYNKRIFVALKDSPDQFVVIMIKDKYMALSEIEQLVSDKFNLSFGTKIKLIMK